MPQVTDTLIIISFIALLSSLIYLYGVNNSSNTSIVHHGDKKKSKSNHRKKNKKKKKKNITKPPKTKNSENKNMAILRRRGYASKHALIISCVYPNNPLPQVPINDRNMSRFLKLLGFTIMGSLSDGQDIVADMKHFVANRCNPHSHFVIYFTGHGEPYTCDPSLGPYLIQTTEHNARCSPRRYLHALSNIINLVNNGQATLTIILQCCFGEVREKEVSSPSHIKGLDCFFLEPLTEDSSGNDVYQHAKIESAKTRIYCYDNNSIPYEDLNPNLPSLDNIVRYSASTYNDFGFGTKNGSFMTNELISFVMNNDTVTHGDVDNHMRDELPGNYTSRIPPSKIDDIFPL